VQPAVDSYSEAVEEPSRVSDSSAMEAEAILGMAWILESDLHENGNRVGAKDRLPKKSIGQIKKKIGGRTTTRRTGRLKKEGAPEQPDLKRKHN
jgi:hypothetical protein